jgi:hypothetical protein
MAKPRIFLNDQLQKEFDENGFVKFSMFSKEQVEKLHNFYLKTQIQHETVIDKKKFHATNDTDNAGLIASADEFIKQVMFEEIDNHFCNYKTIAANYLLKQNSVESDLLPHQDLRFVDEEKFYSFNIWVATKPTNKTNGCLRFLKGSHRIQDTIRPLPSYPWKYQSVISLIPKYFTDVTTEIGDCVVLNHACIHGSYPNLSGHTRIAAILAMIPKEAEIFHYFLPEGNPNNKVEKYAMTLDDFINLKVGHRPEHAPLLESFNYDFSEIEEASFINWVNNNFPDQKKLNNKNGYALIKDKLCSLFGVVK